MIGTGFYRSAYTGNPPIGKLNLRGVTRNVEIKMDCTGEFCSAEGSTLLY